MRRFVKHQISATVSVLALMALPQAALAQAAPADTAATDTSADIVVTGVRASLQNADDIKRKAASNVNAISAEDLGKFTDTSIADALQRVPGVQIQRDNRAQGPGTQLSIRGLGADFVLSTINGREYFGNPAFGNYRNVDYDSIPPEVLSSVVIYKSPTASLLEPGLAGEVDLRTLHPLDQKMTNGHDIFAVLTAQGQLETKLHKVEPKISGVIGGKFLDDTLGFYVSGIYNKEVQKVSNYYLYTGGGPATITLQNAGGGSTVYNNIQLPQGFSNAVETRENTRTAFAAGIEWKPNEHWHLNLDFEFNRLQRNVLRDGGDGYLGYAFGYNTGNTFTVQPGGATIRGTDLVAIDTTKIPNVNGSRGTVQIGIARNRYQDQNFTAGGNLAYHSGRFDATLDYAHSESKYITTGIGFSNYEGQLTTDIIANLGIKNPTISFVTPQNYKDINLYLSQGYTSFPGAQNNAGARDQAKLDLSYKLTDELTLKAGARYAQSRYTRRNIAGYIDQLYPTTSAQNGTVQLLFYPTALPSINFDTLYKQFPQVGDFVANGAPVLTGALPTDFNAANAQYGFGGGDRLTESTTAIYGQIDGDTHIGGWHVSGNIGIRALNVYDKGAAYQGTVYRVGATGTQTPGTTDVVRLITATNRYWRFLPAVNILMQPSHDINLRLSYNKALSLPGAGALIPAGTGVIRSPDLSGITVPNSFGGGNIRLKPTTSDNYDATFEYYPGHVALVASVFYKKIYDLIAGISTSGTVPGQPAGVFFGNIGTVGNAFSGHAVGVELSANVPFTFLKGPLDGFGVEANYTFVDGKARFFAAPEPESPLPGSSKHNASVTAYYEKGGVSLHASYTYRSDYLLSPKQFDHGDYVRASASLDVSASYDFTPNLSVIAGATNLTRSKEQHYLGTGQLTSGYFNRPTTITFGVRAKY